MPDCTDQLTVDTIPYELAKDFSEGKIGIHCLGSDETQTLAQIAELYKISVDQIASANALPPNGDLELTNVQLIIPIRRNRWRDWEMIQQLPLAEAITDYFPETDTYQTRDGTEFTRSELNRQLFGGTPFYANQAVNDFFADRGGEERFRDELLWDIYLGLINVGVSVNDFEAFKASFHDVSTAEIAVLALEVAEGIHQQDYQPTPLDSDTPSGSISNPALGAVVSQDLEIAGTGYLAAYQLDQVRQALQTWQPELEVILLQRLDEATNGIPTTILIVPIKFVQDGFRQFHSEMLQRYKWLKEMGPMVEDYERERAERIREGELQDATSLPWWLELGLGIVFEPLDWIFTLRDIAITGEVSALDLAGLLPLIPSNATRGIGRVISKVPGAGTLGHWAQKVPSDVKHTYSDLDNFDDGLLPDNFDGPSEARKLVDEAGQIIGVNPDKLVDEVLFITPETIKKYPHLDLDERPFVAAFTPFGGKKYVSFTPRVFEDPNNLSRLKHGVHEIIHARDFDNILKETGDFDKAVARWNFEDIGNVDLGEVYYRFREIQTWEETLELLSPRDINESVRKSIKSWLWGEHVKLDNQVERYLKSIGGE